MNSLSQLVYEGKMAEESRETLTKVMKKDPEAFEFLETDLRKPTMNNFEFQALVNAIMLKHGLEGTFEIDIKRDWKKLKNIRNALEKSGNLKLDEAKSKVKKEDVLRLLGISDQKQIIIDLENQCEWLIRNVLSTIWNNLKHEHHSKLESFLQITQVASMDWDEWTNLKSDFKSGVLFRNQGKRTKNLPDTCQVLASDEEFMQNYEMFREVLLRINTQWTIKVFKPYLENLIKTRNFKQKCLQIIIKGLNLQKEQFIDLNSSKKLPDYNSVLMSDPKLLIGWSISDTNMLRMEIELIHDLYECEFHVEIGWKKLIPKNTLDYSFKIIKFDGHI